MPAIRLRQRHGSPTTSFYVNGSTAGTAYGYAPFLADRTVYRTPLVPQDADVIDLQQEVAYPWSPTALTWLVSGPASQYFYSLGNGKIAWNAGNRAGVPTNTDLILYVTATNAYGTSSQVTLTVRVPSNSNCRFVSYGSGSDSNDGTAPNRAWKFTPYSYDFSGTLVTLGANQVLFFKAEIHRTWLAQTKAVLGSQLPHAGSSQNAPFVYSGTGWGGRATIDGSMVISGGTTPSSNDVFGNPNYPSLLKFDMTAQGAASGTVAYWQHFFDGPTMLYPAQWPTPSVLQNFEDPQGPGPQTSPKSGGMWQVSTTPGDDPSFTVSGGTATIKDSRIATRYGNLSITQMPLKVLVWGSGNNISYIDLANAPGATYNFATSTLTFPISFIPTTSNGKTSYALTHHYLDIVQAGQYGLSSDGNTAVLYPPNNSTFSVARLGAAFNVGQVNYVIYTGFTTQRSAGQSSASPPYRGSAFANLFSGQTTGLHLVDIHVNQIRCEDGDGSLYQNNGGAAGGIVESNVERISFTENPRGGGHKCGGVFQGLTGTPTPAQVTAYAYGKVRGCYCPQYGMGRTFAFYAYSTGIEWSLNVVDNLVTVHGNGLSFYNDTTPATFTTYNVVRYNWWNNVERPYTTSASGGRDPTLGRFNYFYGNVIMAEGPAPGLDMFTGEPLSTFTRNIVMGGAGYTYTGSATDINVGYSITMTNNVLAGIQTSGGALTPASGQSIIYTLTNNLLTKNAAPVESLPNQIQHSNTVSQSAPTLIWDYAAIAPAPGTITGPPGSLGNEMATALGPGQVGPFWSV